MSPVFNTLMLFLLSINISLAAENIKVRNARINEGPPTVKVHAGYLDIINDTEKAIELLAANSPAFEKIEFHITRIHQGITSMQRQEKILIPARTIFSFSPGQYHLMLLNNKQPVRQGDIIPLELVFSNGKSIRTGMQVIHIIPGENNHHHDR